jgi:hypothetical protein
MREVPPGGSPILHQAPSSELTEGEAPFRVIALVPSNWPWLRFEGELW